MNSRKSNLPSSTVAQETLNKKAQQIGAERVLDKGEIDTGRGQRGDDVKNDARSAYNSGGSSVSKHSPSQPVPTPAVPHQSPEHKSASQSNQRKDKQTSGDRPTEKDEKRNVFAKERQ
jgi:hypothetical protein